MPDELFTCRVERVGPAEDGNVYIVLNDEGGRFRSQWFTANNTIQREILSTALTAIATGLLVDVWLASTAELGQVNRLYIRLK